MKNLIWLASYPKSGNTWVRLFLSSLIDGQKPLNINNPKISIEYHEKYSMEDILDIDTNILSPDKIEKYLKITYTHISDTSSENIFIKSHDPSMFAENDFYTQKLKNVTKKVIYIVRNPLDITISLSNYLGFENNQIIESYINSNGRYEYLINRPGSIFPIFMGGWSKHLEDWERVENLDILYVRYEDLLQDPFKQFNKILEFIDLKYLKSDILKAIEETKFENLKKQESLIGFGGYQSRGNKFFNNGKSNTWKNVLSTNQINLIKTKNEKMMKKFGYWE